MKLEKIVNSENALISLSKSSLPISISWELRKLIHAIEPHIASYNEIKNKKIVEMGKEEDGMTKVLPENIPEFTKQIMELLSKDIDITFPVIKIKDLLEYKDAQGNGISISTSDLVILDWLVVE